MMLNLSSALGRLVLAGREMARLSGFSSRVTGLLDVIDDVNRAVYKKGILPKSSEKSSVATVTVETRKPIDSPVRNAGMTDHTTAWTTSGSPRLEAAASTDSEKASLLAGQRKETADLLLSKEYRTGVLPRAITGHPELAPEAGFSPKGQAGVSMGSDRDESRSALKSSGSMLVNKSNVIEFIDVPIVTPTGEVLIEALSFKVMVIEMDQSSAFRRCLHRCPGALYIRVCSQLRLGLHSVVIAC